MGTVILPRSLVGRNLTRRRRDGTELTERTHGRLLRQGHHLRLNRRGNDCGNLHFLFCRPRFGFAFANGFWRGRLFAGWRPPTGPGRFGFPFTGHLLQPCFQFLASLSGFFRGFPGGFFRLFENFFGRLEFQLGQMRLLPGGFGQLVSALGGGGGVLQLCLRIRRLWLGGNGFHGCYLSIARRLTLLSRNV